MNLIIQGIEVTPSINDYVKSKLQRIQRHFDHVIDLDVLLTIDNSTEKGKRQKACSTLHVRGKSFHAEDITDNLYASIDGMYDKLDKQVIKHKEKLTDHHQDDPLKYRFVAQQSEESLGAL